MNIGRLLTRRALQHPDRVAVTCRGESLTYAQLNARANQLAHGLKALGLKKGDRVALLFYNRLEFPEVLFGAAKLGAILVPLNFRLAGPEFQYMLNDSGASAIIYEDAFAPTIDAIRPGLETVQSYLMLGQAQLPYTIDYEAWRDQASPAEPDEGLGVELADELKIIYTSGTTGRPKGAVLTHQNALFTSLNQIIDFRFGPDDVNLAAMPMFHVGLYVMTFANWYGGGRVVVLPSRPSFDPEEAVATIQRERATNLIMVPSQWHMILQIPGVEKYDLSSLRLAVAGGAPVPMVDAEQIVEIFHLPWFGNAYGLTEASSTTSVSGPGDLFRKPGTCGRPLFHNEMRVVNDQDRELLPGEVGELLQRGPCVMKEYWRRPEATAETVRNGWLHTGDLAKIDEEGYVYIVDRKKDLIISGGENIYPAEVEDVLYRHPQILEVAIIGVPDEKWGESVKALVVPKPGQKLAAQEVIDFCRPYIASYKKPRYVEFVDSLPRTPSGKVIKPILREKYGHPGP